MDDRVRREHWLVGVEVCSLKKGRGETPLFQLSESEENRRSVLEGALL